MMSKTFYIVSYLLVISMLFCHCAVSISWVLHNASLAQVENTDFTNKTSENNESNETDTEDDTEEELIFIYSSNSTSKLVLDDECTQIHKYNQSLYLDVIGIPPELS